MKTSKTKVSKEVKKLRIRDLTPLSLDGSWSYTACPPAQAEYIRVRNGVVEYTRELRNGLLIDLNLQGEILGIEILNTLPPKRK